jgi:N-formylglutamate amidohydrolase
MENLRRSAEKQCAIVEVHVLAKNHNVLQSGSLPDFRVGCRQKISIGEMFGFVTTRPQPIT